MTAHWGVADPAGVIGTEAEVSHAFSEAYRQLRNRILAFVNLPMASLDHMRLKKNLDDIGHMND